MAERADPDRSWKGAFGASANGTGRSSETSSAPTADSPPNGREASYEAINDAYRVIDEYLRQGQRMAEQFWMPGMGSNGPMSEYSRMFERFMRSAGDMGNAWFEMMTQWSSPPPRTEAPRGTAGPFGAGKTTRHGEGDDAMGVVARSATGGGISVQVESSQKFRIAVDLLDAIEPADIELRELVAFDRTLPAIANVELERDSSGRVTVRIRVPEGQPQGVYNGMLLERGTHRPRGTVSLALE